MARMEARGNMKDIVLYECKRTTNHETVLNSAWAAVKHFVFACKCGSVRPNIDAVKVYIWKHMALAGKLTKNKKLRALFTVFEHPEDFVIEEGMFRKVEQPAPIEV